MPRKGYDLEPVLIGECVFVCACMHVCVCGGEGGERGVTATTGVPAA